MFVRQQRMIVAARFVYRTIDDAFSRLSQLVLGSVTPVWAFRLID
jgi:hypothetical protein